MKNSNKKFNKKSTHVSEEITKSSNLLKYLKERIQLRNKSVRSIDNYENSVWLSDIPESKYCFIQPMIKVSPSSTEDELQEKWIEIKKPKLTNAPKLPRALEEWIDCKNINNPNSTLTLKETIEIITNDENNEEIIDVKKLADNNYLHKILKEYIKNKWGPWSQIEKINHQVQDIYSELYTIYSNQKKLNETYEVLLGVGYLTWKTPSNYEVKRHGITVKITIDFDARRGVITVMPSGVNGFTYFEQDMLDYNEQLHGKEEETIKDTVKELRFNVWGSKQVHSLLNSWINYLSPQGTYFNKNNKHTEITNDPIVSFAPAIILRKRGHRNFIEFIEKANENILETEKLPDLVKKFVLPVNKQIIDVEQREDENTIIGSNEGMYFPLPANDEQKKILTELNKKPGILVEGPPGTGKSHTIANISTHLLACGKKVLITSQGVRALKVLKDKFPKEIQSLCINVLGDDVKANQTLKESVEDINDRESQWDANKENLTIQHIEKELKEAKKQEVLIIKDLIAIREQETKKHDKVFCNYSGTLSEIAKTVSAEKHLYNWINHKKESHNQCPVTNEELNRILDLMRLYSFEQKNELEKFLIQPAELWKPEKFSTFCAEKSKIINELEVINKKKKLDISTLFIKERKKAEILLDLSKELISSLEELDKKNYEWINNIIDDVFNNSSIVWKSLLEQTKIHITKTRDLFNQTKDLHITGLDKTNHVKIQSDVQSLLLHLKSGKGFGFGVFKSKIIKETEYIWSKVKIDGKIVKDLNSLEKLLKIIQLTSTLDKLQKDWSFSNTVIHNDENLQIAQFEDLIMILDAIIKFETSLNKFKNSVQTNENNILTLFEDKETILQYSYFLKEFILCDDRRIIEENFKQYLKLITESIDKHDSHKIVSAILEDARNENIKSYGENYENLIILYNEKKEVEELKKLLEVLKKSMPEQYNDFKDSYKEICWDERFKIFNQAWYWSQANSWIERLTDPKEYDLLEHKHTNILKKKAELIELLASKKSWSHFFGPNGIQPDQLESLKAWAKLITAIGRGKGKYAARKTRAAKDKMLEMQDSIPCWVMPLYRVVENFKPGKDLFDVVIIDEASQSGPEAMILFFLAKKIIIVGDDKQIAPENIQTNENSLVEIGKKYLQDLPHNEIFCNRETSFFDIGEVRIGGRIRLREHFRCVDEIIEYCNKRFYKGQSLIPLRQFGSDRLVPINTVYVRDGYREGGGQHTQNEPEADQIVRTIQNCLNDEKYKDKSIGVISLQGMNQARIIEQKLISAIGAEKYEEHDIRCGDASSFQGDERNVIFLSMVIASNEPFGTLTKLTYARRYNVAVSRAKDQLWLFHSVDLDELNPNCERAQLLSYCLNPDLEKEEEFNQPVPLDEQVKPFESLFEQRVYMKIIEKGYKVIPQFETYGRRIDLVIQGKKERLAVECDGDHWHGPEKHEEDISRQRDLERCGWVFWRIRESSFYKDQVSSLNNLWKMLEDRGIMPQFNNNDIKKDYDNIQLEKNVA